MAQASQTTPTVPININGTNHQVNIRDYLNIRVAPFLKKAITESLDASPEFPLQWLGESLIHQSMLYEQNPDSTNIRERFLYKFDTPTTVPAAQATPTDFSAQADSPREPTLSISESAPASNAAQAYESTTVQDAQMSNHVNGGIASSSDPQVEESKDTEMEGTS